MCERCCSPRPRRSTLSAATSAVGAEEPGTVATTESDAGSMRTTELHAGETDPDRVGSCRDPYRTAAIGTRAESENRHDLVGPRVDADHGAVAGGLRSVTNRHPDRVGRRNDASGAIRPNVRTPSGCWRRSDSWTGRSGGRSCSGTSVEHPERAVAERDVRGAVEEVGRRVADGDRRGHGVRLGIHSGDRMPEGVGDPHRPAADGDAAHEGAGTVPTTLPARGRYAAGFGPVFG